MKDVSAERISVWSKTTKDRLVDSRTWIANTVNGHSFADVGGLWLTVNEKVSDAVLGGARQASMLDITPLGHALWKDFDDRCASRGVSAYQCTSVDATVPDLVYRVGTYDVVHCSGVIYHVPDLVAFVRNLMSITVRYLILQSMVVPDRIENEFGVLDLSGGNCLFIPVMNEKQRKITGGHFESLGLQIAHLNGPRVETWVHRGLWNYPQWVWLITPDFLRGLVQACGLAVIDEGFVWKDRAYAVFCETPPALFLTPLPAGFSHLLSSLDKSLVDLSLHKRARQSSLSKYSVGTTVEEDASRAVTGSSVAPYAFHTEYETNPWWEVDLGSVCSVRQIVVHNRLEADYLADRAFPLQAFASLDGSEWSPLFVTPDRLDNGRDLLIWTASELVRTRFVRLSVSKSSWLHLRQVQILGFS